MPNIHSTLTSLFIDIASAIREKGGTTTSIIADTFPSAIRSLSTSDDTALVKYIEGGSDKGQGSSYSTIWSKLTKIGVGGCAGLASGNYNFNNVSFIDDIGFYNADLTTASFPLCTDLGDGVFRNCSNLTSVDFPLCSYLGNNMFTGCTNLLDVEFSNVQVIPSGVFHDCHNLTIAHFNNCVSIGASAFANCYSLSVASYPHCTVVGSYAFANCSNLSSVQLSTLSRIEDGTFMGTNMQGFIPTDGLEYVGKSAFANCMGISEITFPSTMSSLYIDAYAFDGCVNLSTVSAATENFDFDSTTFNGCNIQNLYIPTMDFNNQKFMSFSSTLKNLVCSGPSILESYMISDYRVLKSVTFNAATSLSGAVFYQNSTIETINLPNVTSYDNNSCFRSCSSLVNINMPEVTRLQANTFYDCVNLKSVSIPKCTNIANDVFHDCYVLESINFPSCTSIGGAAFFNCYSLRDVSLPACTSLGNQVFRKCYSLSTITFTVTNYFGNSVFYDCSSLTTVYINTSRPVRFGSDVFYGCGNLTSLYLLCPAVVTMNYSTIFQNTPMVNSTYIGRFGSVYVPSSLYNSYLNSTVWSWYSSRFVSI